MFASSLNFGLFGFVTLIGEGCVFAPAPNLCCAPRAFAYLGSHPCFLSLGFAGEGSVSAPAPSLALGCHWTFLFLVSICAELWMVPTAVWPVVQRFRLMMGTTYVLSASASIT